MIIKGLRGTFYSEVSEVSQTLNLLDIDEEISFTYDEFMSEELYDTVIEAFNTLDMKLILNTGVNRWYSDGIKTFRCDFRNDIIIVRRV